MLTLLDTEPAVKLQLLLSGTEAVTVNVSDSVTVVVWLMALVRDADTVSVGLRDAVRVMLDADALPETVADWENVQEPLAVTVPDQLALRDGVPEADTDLGVEEGDVVGEKVLEAVTVDDMVALLLTVGEVLQVGEHVRLRDAVHDMVDEMLDAVAVPQEPVCVWDGENVLDSDLETDHVTLPDLEPERGVAVPDREGDQDSDSVELGVALLSDPVGVPVLVPLGLQVKVAEPVTVCKSEMVQVPDVVTERVDAVAVTCESEWLLLMVPVMLADVVVVADAVDEWVREPVAVREGDQDHDAYLLQLALLEHVRVLEPLGVGVRVHEGVSPELLGDVDTEGVIDSDEDVETLGNPDAVCVVLCEGGE
uniref:Uncharacterized protein n=1 Tax=Eutreptiella gymnastica TaxID=73025 RepID=A0A7S1JBF4_9EUGL|mmetsp:Transcript_81670/g.144062  ORF Transcript_81670/g.144062 Transcript_81670/m.144062 type:complete len:366 (+) Transcript_81670:3521-4618(+)